MNSFLTWGAYFLRQAAYAFTLVAGLLLIAEILLPGSVLPFFNLHALVFAVVVMHLGVLAFPAAQGHLATRLAVLIPLGLLCLAAVFFTVWGGSVTAMLLSAALVAVMIGIVVASAKSSS